ncbi:MAG: nucleotide pyrophosphohydrolase [Planctomycetota bacterium]
MTTPDPTLRAFQQQIEALYRERDAGRGVARTYMWFVEEVGELARCLLTQPPGGADEAAEFADCLAWLSTLASLRGVDLGAVAWQKYGAGCPRCALTPCSCAHRRETPL